MSDEDMAADSKGNSSHWTHRGPTGPMRPRSASALTPYPSSRDSPRNKVALCGPARGRGRPPSAPQQPAELEVIEMTRITEQVRLLPANELAEHLVQAEMRLGAETAQFCALVLTARVEYGEAQNELRLEAGFLQSHTRQMQHEAATIRHYEESAHVEAHELRTEHHVLHLSFEQARAAVSGQQQHEAQVLLSVRQSLENEAAQQAAQLRVNFHNEATRHAALLRAGFENEAGSFRNEARNAEAMNAALRDECLELENRCEQAEWWGEEEGGEEADPACERYQLDAAASQALFSPESALPSGPPWSAAPATPVAAASRRAEQFLAAWCGSRALSSASPARARRGTRPARHDDPEPRAECGHPCSGDRRGPGGAALDAEQTCGRRH